ncbi:MAG: hypothetical protein ACI957_003931, partial [Verrucomicrobiales bacterium]
DVLCALACIRSADHSSKWHILLKPLNKPVIGKEGSTEGEHPLTRPKKREQ